MNIDDYTRPTEAEVLEIYNQLPEQVIDWGMKLINADKAWEKYRGEGMRYGVIDTGIDYAHSDLAPNIAEVASFVDNTNGVDSGFHGTHVASITAAADTSTGVIGVAPAARIYSAKIFDTNNKTNTAALFAAFRWMIEKRVHVVNMSFGGFYPLDIPGVATFLDEYRDRIKEMVSAGIILVAAAGNSGNSKDSLDRVAWPARFPEVIACGAICQELQRANFSSAGPDLDFAMPGVDVYGAYPGNRWARYNGTSQAAPYLSGCILLIQQWALKAMGRVLTLAEMKAKLKEWSLDLGVEGFDVETGYGLVNIGKITTAATKRAEVDIDVPMMLVNGRTMVPLRFIVELNGGQILKWDGSTRTVVFRTAEGRKVTMQVGNPRVVIEDEVS